MNLEVIWRVRRTLAFAFAQSGTTRRLVSFDPVEMLERFDRIDRTEFSRLIDRRERSSDCRCWREETSARERSSD